MKMILLSIAGIAAIIFAPLIVVWSLNTLFPVLAIPYSLQTWTATVILTSIFKTTVSK